jgi:tRNA-dihydrouridine synthase
VKYNSHCSPPSFIDKVNAVKEHLTTSVEWKGTKLAVAEMKRHYSNYFKGIGDFKEIKTKLITSNDINEINEILDFLIEDSEKFEFIQSF